MYNSVDSSGLCLAASTSICFISVSLFKLLLCIFLGWMGGHRYYVNKVGTALLQLFTGGGFGIVWIADLIMIALGKFQDSNRLLIVKWL